MSLLLTFVLPFQGHAHVKDVDRVRWLRAAGVIAIGQAEVVWLYVAVDHSTLMQALQ